MEEKKEASVKKNSSKKTATTASKTKKTTTSSKTKKETVSSKEKKVTNTNKAKKTTTASKTKAVAASKSDSALKKEVSIKKEAETAPVKSLNIDEKSKVKVNAKINNGTTTKKIENKSRKFEKIACVIAGIVFVILLIASLNNSNFVPATLISASLVLFCLCYYYAEDDSKKALVYTLFTIGIALIFFEIVYLIMKLR